MDQEPSSLEQLIDLIDETAGGSGQVTLSAVLGKVGRRSFGVLLLVAGLITVAPVIGDIPGVPTIMGLFVLLTTTQLLARREHFWMPKWILDRSISKGKLDRALRWTRPAARFVDGFLRPRLVLFVQDSGVYAIAAVCAAIGAVMPVMELIPFSANGAGAALTAFGLSLTARDGLVALLAYIFTLATFGTILYLLI